MFPRLPDFQQLFDPQRAGRLLLKELAIPTSAHWRPKHKPLVHERAEDFVVAEIDSEGMVCEAMRQKAQPSRTHNRMSSFVLTKFRCSTEAALRLLSKSSGLKEDKFSISGRKDTFALTSQRVQVPSPAFSHLKDMCGKWPELWISGWKEEAGELWHQGNYFKLNLRWRAGCGIQLHERLQLQEAISQLTEAGFPNYYGPQRFGLMAHVSGRHILRQEYGQAMRASFSSLAALSGMRGFHAHSRALEEFLEGKAASDTQKSVWKLSRGRCLASKLLNVASRTSDPEAFWVSMPQEGDFAVDALSALLWNYMAAFRLEHYGWSAVQGDLVRQTTASGTHLRVIGPGEAHAFRLADVYLPRLFCKNNGNTTGPAEREPELILGQPMCSSRPLFPALPALEQYVQSLLASWGLGGLPEATECASRASKATAWCDFYRPRVGFPFRSVICLPTKLGVTFCPEDFPSNFERLNLFIPSKHRNCPHAIAGLPSAARSVKQLECSRVDFCAENEAAAKVQLNFVLPVGAFATCLTQTLAGWDTGRKTTAKTIVGNVCFCRECDLVAHFREKCAGRDITHLVCTA
ncbi:PUS7 [Symbiodinium natans]|uniref:PUS7 protein n=1 Tax=Symbiodinium natans TaxID=878477 RepID=A0A812S4V8_9DINO|nr:PUS7 [Symbiodinium natans]